MLTIIRGNFIVGQNLNETRLLESVPFTPGDSTEYYLYVPTGYSERQIAEAEKRAMEAINRAH